MMQHHNYSLTELDNMIPWERQIYVSMLIEYIKEETLTDTLSFKVEMEHGTEISFDGIQTKLSINK